MERFSLSGSAGDHTSVCVKRWTHTVARAVDREAGCEQNVRCTLSQCKDETEPASSPERWPLAPMSGSTWWRKSTNSNDNRHTNANCEVLQLLPKELEEHKTTNNKHGIGYGG